MPSKEKIDPNPLTPAERKCAEEIVKDFLPHYKLAVFPDHIELRYLGEVIAEYKEPLSEELGNKIHKDAVEYQAQLIEKGDDLMLFMSSCYPGY